MRGVDGSIGALEGIEALEAPESIVGRKTVAPAKAGAKLHALR